MSYYLYYTQGIDTVITQTLSEIASVQPQITEKLSKAASHLLNYLATNPDAMVHFRARDIILKVHSDAAHLVATRARSRVGGFLSRQ